MSYCIISVTQKHSKVCCVNLVFVEITPDKVYYGEVVVVYYNEVVVQVYKAVLQPTDRSSSFLDSE